MVGPIPYSRVIVVAIGSAAVLAFVLHQALGDWVAALHLAVIITFEVITLALAVHALVLAIIKWRRRKRDDPDDPDDPGYQKDFGLAG